MKFEHKVQPPFGWHWRAAFSSDGSESTGSKEREGQRFIVLRQLTDDEADPIDDPGNFMHGHVPLWRVQFEDGGTLDAWDDEIVVEVERDAPHD